MATQFAPAALPSPPPWHKSPWNSPVPYVFGGLAAMLGLIAFALLILACSLWNLNGESENPSDDGGERDLEAGGGTKAALPVFEEKYLVIMAGQEKPTFLATPRSNSASSFGSSSSKRSIIISSSENNCMSLLENNCQEKKVESSIRIH